MSLNTVEILCPEVNLTLARTTLGASLIAVGQSGADNFMAIATYPYYKLHQLTNDSHFLKFARFLDNATKQVLAPPDSPHVVGASRAPRWR